VAAHGISSVGFFPFHWRNSLLSGFHCCSAAHTPDGQLANPRGGKLQIFTNANPHECSEACGSYSLDVVVAFLNHFF
jgi:hypothetical protein